MEANVILILKCANSAAIKHANDVIIDSILKKKLMISSWEIKTVPYGEPYPYK